MTEFKKKWCEYFIQVITPFMETVPSIEMVYRWFFDEKYTAPMNQNEYDTDLQLYVINYTKKEFVWTSGIGLIDSCKDIVDGAISNGNILTQKEYGIHRWGERNKQNGLQ